MKKNINKYFFLYLSTLFIFGVFFLYEKHSVANDSTISEWLINYSGGFTKRGLVGQICIYISNTLIINLRDSILIFQIIIFLTYFVFIYNFFRNIIFNKLMILAIFSPIFILYPIAEIEVLMRKEILIFCFFLIYLYINNKKINNIYKLLILPTCILIWEPVVFFLFFWFSIDLINNKISKLNYSFYKILLSFVPTFFVAILIVLNPINDENYLTMVNFLKNNFNETCYMSCELLKSKSTIYDQFFGNFHKYSFEVFFRYFLIILIGFGPLFIISKNSSLKLKNIIFFNFFNNLLSPILIMLSPVILLFAMGYDWGRWVNISYVFAILFYFYLYKEKFINIKKINYKSVNFIIQKKRIFLIFFIIFCFGWNPKTVISGDVASFPGYRIPYKVIKIINLKYLKIFKKNFS